MLGLEAPEADLRKAFRAAADVPTVRGFAVGRTIFAEPARAWLGGELDDEAATDDMAERFGRLVAIWKEARQVRAA
jgi:5-dehydro-2-deoxygluconokinase